MTQSKHTPAPWEIEVSEDTKTFYILNGNNDGWEPIVSSWAGNEHATMENAHLCAAAPELLEACEQALEEVYNAAKGSGKTFPSIRTLRKAIAKARGEA